MRYVFMGSPPFAATVLEGVAQEFGSPQLVVAQPARAAGRGQVATPTAVETFAQKKGWRVLPTSQVNDSKIVDTIRALEPDILLVAAFGQILKTPLLESAKKYCLNVHASLLPKYRGAAPITRALLDGLKETGITIQKMALKLDTGDMLLQKTLTIAPTDTTESLTDRLAILGAESAVLAFRQIAAGEEKFTPQIESQASHAAKLQKTESILDWNLPADVLERRVRAFLPWPVAETKLGGNRVRVFAAQLVAGQSLGIGQVQTDAKTFLWVGAGQGTVLSLTEIQPENRKKLKIAEYLAAFRGSYPVRTVG